MDTREPPGTAGEEMNDGAKMTTPVGFRHVSQTVPLRGGLSAALVAGFAVVLVIEGAVLHLWIATRSHFWAWAITALNVATLVWLWLDYSAGTRSTLSIDDDVVEITIGNRMRCRFARSNIASAEPATWRSVPDLPPPEYVNTAKPLEPNVTLVLAEPVEARLALGLRKRYVRIAISVDDPAAVLAALNVPTALPQSRS